MVCILRRNERGGRGGIIKLVRVIEEHEAALDFDLMTKTGRTLGEYMDMGAAGKVALIHFIDNLDTDSALARELCDFDAREWSATFKTNVMLADVFDAIREFSYMFAAANSKSKPKQPQPYPRPWGKKSETYGKDPIPIAKFDEWWNSKESK